MSLTQAQLLIDCALEDDQGEEKQQKHDKAQVGKAYRAQIRPCIDLGPHTSYCTAARHQQILSQPTTSISITATTSQPHKARQGW